MIQRSRGAGRTTRLQHQPSNATGQMYQVLIPGFMDDLMKASLSRCFGLCRMLGTFDKHAMARLTLGNAGQSMIPTGATGVLVGEATCYIRLSTLKDVYPLCGGRVVSFRFISVLFAIATNHWL